MGFTDARVKAIVPQAPATGMLPIMGYQFKDLPVPVMIQTGGMDNTLDPEVESLPAYEGAPSPKFFFELLHGGHFTYSDVCQLDLVHIANDMGISDAEHILTDGCGEDNVSKEVADPMIRQFAIGFFNYYLRHSVGSMKYFDDSAAAQYSDELLYLSSP